MTWQRRQSGRNRKKSRFFLSFFCFFFCFFHTATINNLSPTLFLLLSILFLYYISSFLCLSLSFPPLLLTFTFFVYFLPFFNLHTFKLYPSKRASFNVNVRAPYPRINSQLSWFTHDLLSYLVYSILRSFIFLFFHIHTAAFPSCVATSPSNYLISLSLLNEN